MTGGLGDVGGSDCVKVKKFSLKLPGLPNMLLRLSRRESRGLLLKSATTCCPLKDMVHKVEPASRPESQARKSLQLVGSNNHGRK